MSLHLTMSLLHFSEKSVIDITVFSSEKLRLGEAKEMPMASQLTRAGALVGRQAASRKPCEDAGEQIIERGFESTSTAGQVSH